MGLFSFAESKKFLGLSSASVKGPRYVDVQPNSLVPISSHSPAACPDYPGQLSRAAIQGSYPGQLSRASLPSVCIPPLHSAPAPERVKLALPHWKKIAGPWHLTLIQDGIPLEWIGGPPLPNRLFDSALGLQGRQLELQACRDTIDHYLEIGSIRALLD